MGEAEPLPGLGVVVLLPAGVDVAVPDGEPVPPPAVVDAGGGLDVVVVEPEPVAVGDAVVPATLQRTATSVVWAQLCAVRFCELHAPRPLS